MRRLSLREGLLGALFAVALVGTFVRPTAPLWWHPSDSEAQTVCSALPYTFVTGTIADAGQVNADFNAVVACIQAVKSAPYVPDNATLKTVSTVAFPQGIWRYTFATGSTAPPLFYIPNAGPCSLNGANGDNGAQVKSVDNKCWLAVFPSSVVDARQFGLLSLGDGAAFAQAAADAIYNLGLQSATLSIPIAMNYTQFAVYGGMTVLCGGPNNPLTRTASGQGIYTSDAPGHVYPQGPVKGFKMRDCAVRATAPNTLSGTNIMLSAVDGYALDNVDSTNAGVSAAGISVGSVGCSMTGTGAGTNLTITLVSGVCHVGSAAHASLFGTGVPANTYLVSQTSGSTGGAGVYVTNNATTSSGDALSTTSDYLDTTSITRGVVVAGQEVVCDTCGKSGNVYPVITTVNSSTLSTLDAALSSTIAPRPMVTLSTWQYTNGNRTSTLADANITCVGGAWGCFDGHIRHGYIGWDWRGTAGGLNGQCGNALNGLTSTVGIYLESSQADGGSKYNQNEISDIEPECNFVGVWIANGSDNHLNGFDCQSNVYCIINGTGPSTAQNNRIQRPYCEGYSSADPTIVCVMVGALPDQSIGTEIAGSGSLANTSYVVNLAAGQRVSWNIGNYVTQRTPGEQIYNWEPIPSNLPNNPLGNLPAPLLGGTAQGVTVNGKSIGPVEFGAQAWGGYAAHFNCASGRGFYYAPSPSQNGDTLCRVAGWGQYDSTITHQSIGGYVDMRTGTLWSATSIETKIAFGTTALNATVAADRWLIESDGSFIANGLTKVGNGKINPNAYYVGNTAGVDCTIVGATGHLTVVKGLVTLCN